MKKVKFFLVGVGLFFLFVFFSFLVHKNLFTNFDFDNTVRLQNHISRRFDDFFSFLSLVGGFEIATAFLIIILIFLKKIKGIFIFIFYGFIHLFEIYGKTFVDHFPPPHFMLRTNKIGDFPQFYVRAENSYPSGHAARAAFISVILAFILSRSKKLSKNQKYISYSVIFVYDILMFVSRPYLGEHWSSDVFGGALLGAGLALISLIFI
ncbi:MAG: phosphatase PAP2 family protein [Patescibacteria group bacterium]|nr:phosphatase PAP2 family protein [Patescibacteria group bacterium]